MNDMDLNVKIVVDKSSVKSDLNEIKQDIGSVSDKTKASAQSATSQISNGLKSIKAAVSASIGSTVASFVGATATMKSSAKTIREEVGALASEIVSAFKEEGKAPNAREMLKAQEEAYREYKSVVDDAKTPLAEWRAQWEMVKKSFSETGPLKSIKDGFAKLKESIADSAPWQKLTGYFDKIKNSKLGTWFRAMGEAVKEATKAVLAYVAALTALSIALVKNANAVASLGDEIDKGAQRLNMSTDQYQKWAYAMELCGSSIEELREGYNQMSTKVSQAINGTEDSVAAFEKLGVSLHNSNGELRTTGDIFEDTISKLQQIENPTQRIAAAQQFFGESTSKLNPLLNAEAGFLDEVARTQRALNSEMSDGLVSVSARYKDSITTMKQAWQGLKNTLAEGVLPVLQKVVVWLTVAIAKINIFLKTLFGLKNSDTSSSMDSAAKSTDGYTASVGKATQAVEKLKRQTMGFDEMNILQSNDKSGSGSDSGSDTSYGEMGGLGEMPSLLPEGALADIEQFEEKMDSIKGKVQGWTTAIGIVGGALLVVLGCLSCNIPMILAGIALAGFGIAVGNAGGFDEIAKAVGNFADSTGAWLGPILMVAGALIGIIGLFTLNIPMVVAGIALAGIGLSLANGDLGKLGKEGESTSEVLLGLIPNFVMVAGAIGGVFCLLTGNIVGAIACFALAGVSLAIKLSGTDGIAKMAKSALEKGKTAIKSGLNGIKKTVEEWWTNLDGRAKGILTAVGGFFTTAVGIITLNKGTIDKGLGLIKEGVDLWWNNLSETTQNIIKGIGGVFETVIGLLTGNTTLIKKGLDNISTAITDKKFDEVVKGEWEKITKWWSKNVSPKFTKDYWADKFSSIKEGARSAFNGVIGVIEKAVNSIVNKLNTLNWKIPTWVPGVGGKSFGFNIKQISIPRLATGGIATQSTIANIGENGKEAILPLERNTEWMDMLADKLSARSGNGPSKLILMVDKKVLGEASIEGINNITRETGALQLVMV